MSLVDLLPAIVLVVSTNGRIVRANQEARDRIVSSDGELDGADLHSVCGEPNLFDVLSFESVFLNGPTREILMGLRTPEGDLTCSVSSQVVMYQGEPHVMLVAHSSAELHSALASTARWAASEQDKAEKLQRAQAALAQKNRELQEAQRRISETSRVAGMAEIATGILHNVGNVLNSVNVSAGLVAERLRSSRVSGLFKLSELLEGQTDVATFLTQDPRGTKLVPYLSSLAAELQKEREELDREVRVLQERVDRIKFIVAKQQRFAKVTPVMERCSVADLVSESIELMEEALVRHGIEIVREDVELPEIVLDRHRFVQILVNLLSNSKNALNAVEPTRRKHITVRTTRPEPGRFAVAVEDDGIGIDPAIAPRVFEHGFTTRKEGHGFGLHDSANAASELGGSLACSSDGLGSGATFTLELPLVTVA